MNKIVDLSQEEYTFEPEPGNRGRLFVFDAPPAREGDFVILRNGLSTTRYRVESFRDFHGSSDCANWAADVVFSPRSMVEGRMDSHPG